jgi:biopolymer transport protein ExbD
MKSVKRTSLHPSDSVELPELDVTPIMNMFIILIPFLVSMAVFTHLAVLHFSLPPNAGNGLSKTEEKPQLKLTVVVTDEYLAVTHGEMLLDSIVSGNDGYDMATLSKRLIHHRFNNEVTEYVIVAVRNNVEFKDVVKVMDVCRDAGFKKIGLSNATEDPGRGV